MKKFLLIGFALGCLVALSFGFISGGSSDGTADDAYHADNIDNGGGTNVVMQGWFQGTISATAVYGPGFQYGGYSSGPNDLLLLAGSQIANAGGDGSNPGNIIVSLGLDQGGDFAVWNNGGGGDPSTCMMDVGQGYVYLFSANIGTPGAFNFSQSGNANFAGAFTAETLADSFGQLPASTNIMLKTSGGSSVVSNYPALSVGNLAATNPFIFINGSGPTFVTNAVAQIASAYLTNSSDGFVNIVFTTSAATQPSGSNYFTINLASQTMSTKPLNVISSMYGTNGVANTGSGVLKMCFLTGTNSITLQSADSGAFAGSTTYGFSLLVIRAQ